MKMWIKSICFVFVVAVVMAFASQAKAGLLPWLDFGNSFLWDSGTSTYTDNSTSVTLVGGSTGSDQILDGIVDLTISLLDGSLNGTLDIYSFGSPGNLLLSANILVTNTFDPTRVGIWDATMEVTFLDTSVGTWTDDFATQIAPSDLATLQLTFSGNPSPSVNGVYNIDGGGKISAVPEPGTIALLGIGLAGLVGVGVRRKMKKNQTS